MHTEETEDPYPDGEAGSDMLVSEFLSILAGLSTDDKRKIIQRLRALADHEEPEAGLLFSP